MVTNTQTTVQEQLKDWALRIKTNAEDIIETNKYPKTIDLIQVLKCINDYTFSCPIYHYTPT